MKHTAKITTYLVILFFVSQIIGLAVISQYIDYTKTKITKKPEFKGLPGDLERPDVEGGNAVIYIVLAILIGTALVFVLMRFKKVSWWKIWFFLSVVVTLTISFYALIPDFVEWILNLIGINFWFIRENPWIFPLLLSILLALLKVYRPSLITHNITEIFVYGGLAALFTPMLSVFWASVLLVAISIYDIYAVWKSEHMIKLAKFQTDSKVFAGLFIPYQRKDEEKVSVIKTNKISEKNIKSKSNKYGKKESKLPEAPTPAPLQQKTSNAILGGGDIGFPLIFSGVVMQKLIYDALISNTFSLVVFLKALIIPICATIALIYLFVKGERNKFYPAMPYLTIGCFVGYGVLFLINLL